MTEQEVATAETEPASTSVGEKKSENKSKSPKTATAKPAKKNTQKASSLTDEQKREARNAALREWRKKNKDRYAAYMKEWREKRTGKKPQDEPTVVATTATPKSTAKPAKKPTSKQSAKGGKA